MLIFFTNDFIVNEVFLVWEQKATPIAKLESYETAIVLTGVTNSLKITKDRVHFDKGADRVLHTIQLFRLGKIKKILIAGGSSAVADKMIPESQQLRKVFIYCGLPDSSIIIEDQSRNTIESSHYSKGIIDRYQLGKEFLLITSAYHILRSAACFRKAGLNVTGYSVDFYSHDRSFKPLLILLPSVGALSKWSIVIHEIIGYLVCKLLGYC